MLAQITLGEPPEGAESTYKSGQKEARKGQEQPRKFWEWGYRAYRVGDIAIRVTEEGKGHRLVSPPGKVVHTNVWRGPRNKKYTFVFIEVPQRRCVPLNKLAKRMGYGAKKQLLQDGRVEAEFARKLLAELGG